MPGGDGTGPLGNGGGICNGEYAFPGCRCRRYAGHRALKGMEAGALTSRTRKEKLQEQKEFLIKRLESINRMLEMQ